MAAMLDSPARHDTPSWITEILHSLSIIGRRNRLQRIRHDAAHSNDIFELTFDDGRVLLLKRARHEWVHACFVASAEAARLIRSASDLVTPLPLPLERQPGGMPVQAYWRVPLPTLAQLWPGLTMHARRAALRSLGRLTRRLHSIAAPAWGPLHCPDSASPDLAGELDRDLRQRLLPAVIAHWPRGVTALEDLIARVPSIQRRGHDRRPFLVHTDLHLGNVLCRVHGKHVECVGFLDLDGAAGGAPEADFACFDVLHGPLFHRHIEPVLRAQLRLGHGRPLDDRLRDYFYCAHLANQGFSSALLGHDGHAEQIADDLYRRLRLLDSDARFAAGAGSLASPTASLAAAGAGAPGLAAAGSRAGPHAGFVVRSVTRSRRAAPSDTTARYWQ